VRNTSLDAALSVDEVQGLIQQTIQIGYDSRVASPQRGVFEYTAIIDGKKYFATTEDGKVVQFFPIK
jgi:hypothetical protein